MATSVSRVRRVLLPNNIDRRKSAISTLLREVATRLDDYEFYAFSSPENDDDRQHAEAFWSLPNIVRASKAGIVARRYDLVWHASVTPFNLLAAAAARVRSFGRTAHVFTANVEMGSSLRYSGLFKLALRRAKTLVAVSEAVKKMTEENYGVEIGTVIPNGFDPDFYRPAVDDAPAPAAVPEPERPFILFCGALTQRKRPDVLIEVARRMPEVQFIAVGGNLWPEEGKVYLGQIAELPNVHYLGYQSRSEVRDLMQHARALIFPSEREGLPLSVIEAMGCGCPVLAQPKSSLPEVVVDKVNGWLLEDDPQRWAGCCQELLGWSKAERGRSIERVRNSVTGRFVWDTIAESYDELFRSL